MGKYPPVLPGKRYGRLVVMEESERQNGHKYWKCKCDCGNKCFVYDYSLRKGKTKSCGCHKYSKITKTNIYKNIGDKIEVKTSNGKVFYISKESEWVLKDYCWYISSTGYVCSMERKTGERIKLHSVLMNRLLKEEFEIDHIDGDRVNNCLDNLRVVNKYQNQWNKKRLKDYGIRKTNSKRESYRVCLGYYGKIVCVGTFHSIEEARKARDDWENNHERKEFFRN